MPNIDDIIEQDGQQVRITDVLKRTYEDGSTVTVVTTAPVEKLS